MSPPHKTWSWGLVLALCVTCCVAFSGKNTPPGVPSDVKYIKCQVCELLAKTAFRMVKEMKEANPKLKEETVIEAVEKLLDPMVKEGQWISKLDLVEKGDKLLLKEVDQVGECGSECKTVRLAAEIVLGERDTDMAEALFTGKLTRAQLTNWLCYEGSKACLKKAPPLPKERPAGPAFKVLDAQAAELQNTLAGMKAAGLGGEVYTREEAMAKYMNMMDEDFDVDDLPDDMPYSDILKGKPLDQPPPSKEELTVQGLEKTVGKVLETAQDAYSQVKKGASSVYQQMKSMFSGMNGNGEQAQAEL